MHGHAFRGVRRCNDGRTPRPREIYSNKNIETIFILFRNQTWNMMVSRVVYMSLYHSQVRKDQYLFTITEAAGHGCQFVSIYVHVRSQNSTGVQSCQIYQIFNLCNSAHVSYNTQILIRVIQKLNFKHKDILNQCSEYYLLGKQKEHIYDKHSKTLCLVLKQYFNSK